MEIYVNSSLLDHLMSMNGNMISERDTPLMIRLDDQAKTIN